MEQIRITCWFENSEEFIAKLVITKGVKAIFRKIIDPIAIVTSRGCITGEKYDVYGFTDEVEKLIDILNEYDVEIVKKG